MNAVETQGLRCAIHEDRAAIDRCESCGRATCLDCAVPYRGAVRCERCVAEELGQPVPEPARRRTAPPELLASVGLGVGVVSSALPWHRSGTLTSAFTAWRPTLDPWAAVATLLLVLAFLAAAFGLARSRLRTTRLAVVWGGLSALASISAVVAVARAPGFFSLTPWPYVFAVSGLMGVLTAWIRARRGAPAA